MSVCSLAADAMITDFKGLSPTSSINDAVQALIRTTQHEYPVVDGCGRLRGMKLRRRVPGRHHDPGILC